MLKLYQVLHKSLAARGHVCCLSHHNRLALSSSCTDCSRSSKADRPMESESKCTSTPRRARASMDGAKNRLSSSAGFMHDLTQGSLRYIRSIRCAVKNRTDPALRSAEGPVTEGCRQSKTKLDASRSNKTLTASEPMRRLPGIGRKVWYRRAKDCRTSSLAQLEVKFQ